jgi:hypothetical protein
VRCPGRGPFEDRVIDRGQPPLGNMIARNVAGGGPGVGYTVSKSGPQDMHGPANPGNPPNRPAVAIRWGGDETDDYARAATDRLASTVEAQLETIRAC